MFIATTIEEVRKIVSDWQNEGYKVGLVPTMGFLHEGHESLIQKAVRDNEKVIVSIFVNPMQFGPKEDFSSYPRDLEHDTNICKKAGVHLVFAPDSREMYASDFCTFVDMNGLTDELCGKSREGHFRGVCTVVTKLFNITKSNRAYFGEKDAQQLAVIKRMVRDLNMDIEIIGCPTVREKDGLAKSSRNSYLSVQERKAAVILHESLKLAKSMLDSGERNAAKLRDAISNKITSQPLASIVYVSIVDSITLKSVDKIEAPILIAVSVYIGKTKLIDNFTYEKINKL
ncbi:pantoate--beta-alanine ligase [Anaerovorax odorimutans]|uniref:pantoate--beta-alanine ligase n=1 Tax=Anaerovorax odorimutans TaxID=109327 RepID=UPI0003FD1331|nr:pantoate--beta-alanine ligase [Anaerovorax odorimutans]